MARNGSGTETIPNTLVSGTTITAAALNQNFTDLATEITNSVAADGQTTLTGVLKNSNGTVGSPAITFASDTDSGFYRKAANSVALSLGGADAVVFTSATATFSCAATFQGGALFASTVGVTGEFIASATATFILTANFSSVGKFTGVVRGPDGTKTAPGFSFTGDTDSGIYRIGSNNIGVSCGDTKILDISTTGVAIVGTLTPVMTTQILTSGTAATYTTPAGVKRLIVTMVGAGGGGAAQATNGGANGTSSSWAGAAQTAWTAVFGSGGAVAQTGGPGGTGGVDGTGTKLARFNGAPGQTTGNNFGIGGAGGGTVLMQGAHAVNNATAGTDAVPNTGGGGSGASGGSGANCAGGGGGGEFVKFTMTGAQVLATYTYTVGALGAGGAAGTRAGGNGAAGIIIVEEYYY